MIQLHWLASTTDPRYRDVLAIRRAVYVHAGKLPAAARAEDLADEFDCHAMIALLYVDEAPAGTIRICIAPDRLPCYYARFPGFSEMASRCGRFITGSRMAVLPAYQGYGLFWVLHDVMPEEAEKVGRKFVVGDATGWLLDQYVKAGWERTGHVHAASEFGGMAHEFIMLNVPEWRRRHRKGAIHEQPEC